MKVLLVVWDCNGEYTDIHAHSLWTDQDKLAPKVFTWIEEVYILCKRKTFKTLELFARYWVPLRPDSPTYPQDCTIFFIQLNNVNNEIKNKVLQPHVNSPCHKVAHFLFFNFNYLVWSHLWPQLINNCISHTGILHPMIRS